MSWGSPDVYYQPGEFGLTPVAEIDYSTGSYEFDIRAVWKHEDGALYTMRDSGCSCPSPFEDYTKLEQLDRVDLGDLEREVQEERRTDGWRSPNVSATDAQEFLRKVQEALSVTA